MSSNALFIGWNRAVPGREKASLEHFAEFISYLGGLKSAGKIEGFDPVMLNAHGGDMNGFVVVRGQPAKLGELQTSDEFETHVTRAVINMQGMGVIGAAVGDEIPSRMAKMQKYL